MAIAHSHPWWAAPPAPHRAAEILAARKLLGVDLRLGGRTSDPTLSAVGRVGSGEVG